MASLHFMDMREGTSCLARAFDKLAGSLQKPLAVKRKLVERGHSKLLNCSVGVRYLAGPLL